MNEIFQVIWIKFFSKDEERQYFEEYEKRISETREK
jgi:hypothetical protein